MQMVEVLVPNLDCEGCAAKLKKALYKLKGIYVSFITPFPPPPKFCFFSICSNILSRVRHKLVLSITEIGGKYMHGLLQTERYFKLKSENVNEES